MDIFSARLATIRGSGGVLRRPDGNAAGHAPVGSSGRPPLPGRQPLEASDRTLDTLERLNATSEIELLEGRGVCGRCGGTGFVVAYDLAPDPRHLRSCPRCGGSGQKP